MNTLAEKLVDAWKKRDLIKINSEELPKSREESHNIQKQFHDVLKKKTVGWKIGLVSKNCREWIIADLAITIAGYISVPFFPTLKSNEIKYCKTFYDLSDFLLNGSFTNFEYKTFILCPNKRNIFYERSISIKQLCMTRND